MGWQLTVTLCGARTKRMLELTVYGPGERWQFIEQPKKLALGARPLRGRLALGVRTRSRALIM